MIKFTTFATYKHGYMAKVRQTSIDDHLPYVSLKMLFVILVAMFLVLFVKIFFPKKMR